MILSLVLSYIICLLLLFHMVGSIRYIITIIIHFCTLNTKLILNCGPRTFIFDFSKKLKKYAHRGFVKALPGPISRMVWSICVYACFSTVQYCNSNCQNCALQESSWEFIGVQVGYFFAAWSLYTLVIILLGTAVIVLFSLLRVSITRRWLINIGVGIL